MSRALIQGFHDLNRMLIDSMRVYAQTSKETTSGLVAASILASVICVSIMIYLYTRRIDYEYQRMLMILRFFSESAIRRNKIVTYLLHRYKILSL